jgi:hypothetical protein
MALTSDNRKSESDKLIIYHQNIRSLNNKQDELHIIFGEASLSHLICISEHHMMEQELQSLSMPAYNLASSYCREKHLKGGVCIFVKEDVLYQMMDLRRICREKTFEVCAVKLQIASTKLIVFCIHRAPSGNLNQFFFNFWIVL